MHAYSNQQSLIEVKVVIQSHIELTIERKAPYIQRAFQRRVNVGVCGPATNIHNSFLKLHQVELKYNKIKI